MADHDKGIGAAPFGGTGRQNSGVRDKMGNHQAPQDLGPALRRVDRPIQEASGLPNQAYTSEDFARYERDQLLANTWMCVGVGHHVPNPGDLRPVKILGLPLLLLRDRTGEIRVFHNVCSHRGVELIAGPCSVKRRICCPYHSWTYDLDGSLAATPSIGGPGKNDCPGFNRAQHGLKPLRTAVWADVVFVNLSGDAPPFGDYIAPVAERWGDFDLSLIRHGGPDSSLSFDIACNWKLAVENYCEAYHLPWVHPGLNSYSRLEDHYHIEQPGRFSGQGTTVYRPMLFEDGRGFPEFPGLSEKWNEGAEYIALYPNVLLGAHKDHTFAIVIEPVSHEKCIEHVGIVYTRAEITGDGWRAMREKNAAMWREVFVEDIFVVEGMQKGRHASGFDGGKFSPVMDSPTHCFHHWVATQMQG